MNLAVWANTWDDMPFYDDWWKGINNQHDNDFHIYFSTLEGANDCLSGLVQRYDAILCLDVDDIPEPALINVAKTRAKRYDITGFGMKLVNENNEAYGRFGKMVDIKDYNVWGFGNTVWKSDVMADILPVDFGCATPDWEAVTRAWNNGAYLHFERLPLIRYRQYGQNDRLIKVGDVYVWG